MENTMTIKTTPKDFFMHLLAFASLYASIVSFIALIFAYIDVLFPDPLIHNYISSLNQIRLSSSALLILFAVFLLTSWFLEKEFALNPEKKSIKFRKWLIYLTLFVAAVTVIVDLIILIYNFYSGELTISFLLKVLAVLTSALSVFGYYFKDLKNVPLLGYKSNQPKVWAWTTSLVILGVIIAGFFVVGTPSQQRTRRFDEQRVSDLQNIQYQIVNYWQSKGKLPKNIDDLKNGISGFTPPTDPETHLPYEYSANGLNSFALCAVFKTDSKNTIQINRFKTVRVYSPYDYSGQDWEHGTGRTCFSRNIDSDLYPIRKPAM